MGRRVRKSRSGLKSWKRLVGCVKLMNFAFNNVRIYPPTHSEVKDVVAKLHREFAVVFEELQDVGFGYMDEVLYIEGAMSIEETQNNEALVDRFMKCRLKYVTIEKTASPEDLLSFFAAVNDESKTSTKIPLGEQLGKLGVKTIHVVESDPEDTSKSGKGRRKTLLDWYQKVVGVIGGVHDQIFASKKADLKTVYHVADDMMATIRTKGVEPFLLLPLIAGEENPHTGHCVNTAILCGGLSELAGLNSGQAQTLLVAALLHDLGRKIIPPEWAKEKSPLSLFERAVVHQHTAWGFLLLTRDAEIPTPISLLAAYHHVSPVSAAKNGGYLPDLLHKILSVADEYDRAAFSDRVYWKRQPPHRKLWSMLRGRGKRFDPQIVKLLVQLVGLYPVGSLVRLDDGRRGVVVRSDNPHVGRPRVYLFEEDTPVPAGAAEDATIEIPPPVMCDLMQTDDRDLSFSRSLAGISDPPERFRLSSVLAPKLEHFLGSKL